MDDSTERLLAKLEQATSRVSETAQPPRDETAMLRESWLALGKLLDAADAENQESERAIRRLLDAADAESEGPVARPQPTPRAGLSLRFIAALAASVLVALVVWTFVKRGADSIDPMPEVAVPNELPESAPVIADVAEARPGGEPVETVDEFAWEDSFDEQLAATSQAIRSVQAGWSGGDRRYSVLLDQFEQFDEELSEGSL